MLCSSLQLTVTKSKSKLCYNRRSVDQCLWIKKNSMIRVRERTIPTEQPPLVGEAIANFCGEGVPRGQRDGSLRSYSRIYRQEPLLFYQVGPQLYSRGWVDPWMTSINLGPKTRFLLLPFSGWLPLWSSGQSFSLQIQGSGFDSRSYPIFWERGPFNLASRNEELLGKKVTAPV
jgi:hypothetical protein